MSTRKLFSVFLTATVGETPTLPTCFSVLAIITQLIKIRTVDDKLPKIVSLNDQKLLPPSHKDCSLENFRHITRTGE